MWNWILAVAVVIAIAYQLVAIAACLRHLFRKDPPKGFQPPISILKPVRGLDPGFYEAIRSHALQQYPEFEILFGVSDRNDPAVAEIEQLRAEFPHAPIALIHSTTLAPNGKVGVMIDLLARARHGVILVNDSDIHVPPGYLRDVAAPLADHRISLVTCLYRARAKGLPGKMEALGIATDFAPSTLVAPLIGVNEFGLGSTLVFRRDDLQKAGGFESIAGYLADDYQLAKRLTRGLGRRSWLSHVVVDTTLQGDTWREVWRHQVRWHRTIRVSRPLGYSGLPVTYATLWAAIALAAGHWVAALAVMMARFAMALVAGVIVLECPVARRYQWLAPFRDLFGVAVWVAALFGNSVQWRDKELRLDPSGRIVGRV
jgi:ceramide glucosyltransferase